MHKLGPPPRSRSSCSKIVFVHPDGAGSFFFQIHVRDEAEPGAGADVYAILIGNGYASGDQTLEAGNVQIHKPN